MVFGSDTMPLIEEEADKPPKRIALVAHDGREKAIREWALWNKGLLVDHELVGSERIGRALRAVGVEVSVLEGGEAQQIGALIADGEIDVLVLLWNPLARQSPSVEVQELLSVAVRCNIPVACNRASADHIVSSPLLRSDYMPPDDDL